MTHDDAVRRLKQIAEQPTDPERDHAVAEQILIDYLTSNGAPGIAFAFTYARDKAGFWYA